MTTTFPVIKGVLLSSKNYTWNTADSLGKGASAVVYLGRQKDTGFVVAIKSFHKAFLSSSKHGDLRELELLKHLDHKNIIKLLDIQFEENNRQPVLVMEYCEGGSLHHMLELPQYHYGLNEHEYLLVLTHVADGMCYLRREKIIHRDIKPGNIMRFITDEGHSIYKLTDFGAARNLMEEEQFDSLYGTEEYLHPGVYETAVLRHSTGELFDARVDLWSLGVTFYHAATGQLPFRPYGGRNNRETMFNIISNKDSGVISGVQKTHNGCIEWQRDLPESCPLSNGLRCLITPVLSGLMESKQSKMISYETFFRIVNSLENKIPITLFHFASAQEVVIYADKNWILSDLQDSIASQFDISASDQIILVEGKKLDTVVDSLLKVKDYPSQILEEVIFLFQTSSRDTIPLKDPEIDPFPDMSAFSGMDVDSRHANTCCSIGELINRYAKTVSKRQKLILSGITCLRMYVESLHECSQPKMMLMHRLVLEFKLHLNSIFAMVNLLKNNIRFGAPSLIDTLEEIRNEEVVRPVFQKAQERLSEIERYRNNVSIRLADIKDRATKLSSQCKKDKCCQKIAHRLSMIMATQNRFRRDKNVRHQMTAHDENIHHFERHKLQKHCTEMKAILKSHCFPNQAKLFQDAAKVADFSIRSLNHVNKIDDNITSVLNCQNLLSDKVVKMRQSCTNCLDSGYLTEGYDTLSSSCPSSLSDLGDKLAEIKEQIEGNTKLFYSMEGGPSTILPEIDKNAVITNGAWITEPG